MRGRCLASSTGHTLTEMLIVTALLAAAAAVALPTLRSSNPSRVNIAATQLVQALRFARSEAERTRAPHGLRIDAATERVELFRLDMSMMPPTRVFTVYHPVHRGLYVLDFANDRATAGVQIAAAALSFSGACAETRDVVFDARGWPLCAQPVTVELSAAAIDLAHGTAARRVSVAGVTGRVVMQ